MADNLPQAGRDEVQDRLYSHGRPGDSAAQQRLRMSRHDLRQASSTQAAKVIADRHRSSTTLPQLITTLAESEPDSYFTAKPLPVQRLSGRADSPFTPTSAGTPLSPSPSLFPLPPRHEAESPSSPYTPISPSLFPVPPTQKQLPRRPSSPTSRSPPLSPKPPTLPPKESTIPTSNAPVTKPTDDLPSPFPAPLALKPASPAGNLRPLTAESGTSLTTFGSFEPNSPTGLAHPRPSDAGSTTPINGGGQQQLSGGSSLAYQKGARKHGETSKGSSSWGPVAAARRRRVYLLWMATAFGVTCVAVALIVVVGLHVGAFA